MDNVESFQAFQKSNRNVIRVFSAVIEEINRERGTAFVTVRFQTCRGCGIPEDTVRLVVNQDTDIYDEWGRNIRSSDLKPAMTVDASFSSAMTRSIPPQAQAYFIRIMERPDQVQTAIGRIASVNTRSSSLLVLTGRDTSSAVQFHISRDTDIFDFLGRRIPLSSLRPGLRVRIEHASFMTASIPPQTTAFTVRIIR